MVLYKLKRALVGTTHKDSQTLKSEEILCGIKLKLAR